MDQDYVIYLDVVFGINFLMDYALLWATAKLGQLETSLKRLTLAAILGSLYSLAVFLPESHWLFFYGLKFLFSLFMVVVAFNLPGLRKIVRAVAYFYLVTFSAAGAMLGAVYFFDNTPGAFAVFNGALLGFNAVKGNWLVWAIAVLIVLGRFGASYLKRRFFSAYANIPVVIKINNHSIPVKALLDTGNRLKDPLNQKPVMIVEYKVLKNILPPSLQEMFEKEDFINLEQVLKSVSQEGWWSKRLRLIPFQAIGTRNGLMLAFRPDVVYVKMEDQLIRVDDAIVGISKENLTQSGNYRALLHVEMLQELLSA